MNDPSFAFLETGAVHRALPVDSSLLHVRTNDLVFRSAFVDNALVLGNATSSNADAAALYIEKNRIGVRKKPSVGLAMDVDGAVACSGTLSLHDGDFKNDNKYGSSLDASHSNLSARFDGGVRTFLDARGSLRSGAILTTASTHDDAVFVVDRTTPELTLDVVHVEPNPASLKIRFTLASCIGGDFDATADDESYVYVIGESAYTVSSTSIILVEPTSAEPYRSFEVALVSFPFGAEDQTVNVDPIFHQVASHLSSDSQRESVPLTLRRFERLQKEAPHPFVRRQYGFRLDATSPTTRVERGDDAVDGSILRVRSEDGVFLSRAKMLESSVVAIGDTEGVFFVDSVDVESRVVSLRTLDGRGAMAKQTEAALNAVLESGEQALMSAFHQARHSSLAAPSKNDPSSPYDRLGLRLTQLQDIVLEVLTTDSDKTTARLRIAHDVFLDPLYMYLNEVDTESGNYVRYVRLTTSVEQDVKDDVVVVPVRASYRDDAHVFLDLWNGGEASIRTSFASSLVQASETTWFVSSKPSSATFGLSGHPVHVRHTSAEGGPYHLRWQVEPFMLPRALDALRQADADRLNIDLIVSDGHDVTRQWALVDFDGLGTGDGPIITLRRKDGQPLSIEDIYAVPRFVYVTAIERLRPLTLRDTGVVIGGSLCVGGATDDEGLNGSESRPAWSNASLNVVGDTSLEGALSFRTGGERARSDAHAHTRTGFEAFEVGLVRDDVFRLGHACEMADSNVAVLGNLSVSGQCSAQSYATLCDARLKTAVQDVIQREERSDIADRLFATPVRKYVYSSDANGRVHTGPLAHELEELFPDAVSHTTGLLPLNVPVVIRIERNEIHHDAYSGAASSIAIATVSAPDLSALGLAWAVSSASTSDLAIVIPHGEAEYGYKECGITKTVHVSRVQQSKKDRTSFVLHLRSATSTFTSISTLTLTDKKHGDVRVVDQGEVMYSVVLALQDLADRVKALERIHYHT